MIKKMVIFLIILLVMFSFVFLKTKYKDEKMNQFKIGLYLADKDLFDAHFILKMKDQIGITEKQESNIENIVLSFRESSIRKNAEIKIKELRLASYLRSDKINRKRIEKVIREISKMKTDSIVYYVNYLFDLKDLLTSEQVEKLKQRRDKMKVRIKKKLL